MQYWTRLIIAGLVFLVLGFSQSSVVADHCSSNQLTIGTSNSVHRCQDINPKPQPSGMSDYARCISRGYSDMYCDCKLNKKGIYLNTVVPFVGHERNPKCLVTDGNGEAGSQVISAITKILTTFVLVGGFGMIIRGGVLITAGNAGAGDNVKKGKDMIVGVMIAFALLGSLGIILRFINPNFFS